MTEKQKDTLIKKTIKLAKKKGYKKGVKVRCLLDGEVDTLSGLCAMHEEVYYCAFSIMGKEIELWMNINEDLNAMILHRNGSWAEIIKN